MKKLSDQEILIFDMVYPNRTDKDIANIFQMTLRQIITLARDRNLNKSKQFIDKENGKDEVIQMPVFACRFDENPLYYEQLDFSKKLGFKNVHQAMSHFSQNGRFYGAEIFRKEFEKYKQAN